jgi:hypothetical protein
MEYIIGDGRFPVQTLKSCVVAGAFRELVVRDEGGGAASSNNE